MTIYNQRGSVFFYILIAIVLFAALSYALSQNSRSSSTVLTVQQTKVSAQNIIEQGDVVSNAVQKLFLRNIRDIEISFENNIVNGYELADCADSFCKVFDINGGSLNWTHPPENVNTGENWIYTGEVPIADNGFNLRNDITMVLPNVSQSICQEINFKLGLVSSNTDPVLSSADSSITITKLSTANPISGSSNYINGAGIDGNNSICVQINSVSGDHIGTNQYYYIHTLYAG